MGKVAPLVHTGNWRHLFACVTLSGQAWARVLLYWSGGIVYKRLFYKKRLCPALAGCQTLRTKLERTKFLYFPVQHVGQ